MTVKGVKNSMRTVSLNCHSWEESYLPRLHSRQRPLFGNLQYFRLLFQTSRSQLDQGYGCRWDEPQDELFSFLLFQSQELLFKNTCQVSLSLLDQGPFCWSHSDTLIQTSDGSPHGLQSHGKARVFFFI